MKPENEQIVKSFLAHADDLSDDLTDDVEEMLGVVPFIFSILRDRPESFALSTLADYRFSRPASLDAKTAELIAVAAAASAGGAESCLKVHIGGAALKEGASRDEVLDVLLIAAMIGKTRVLASSLRQFREVCGKEQGGTGR
ncbi:carboxymuconolactone decarboxylase family protein [Methanoculleus chikugoensis]|uniref:carboxymuconolactone decarboxylase family protein n=1 Tax=Methanoculleus chikugoensis TaxID=118126 RepID=UPI0006D07F22|nr:carboxymuconolactone decarboxylase family protein [Methanoculleus chikugoensis]